MALPARESALAAGGPVRPSGFAATAPQSNLTATTLAMRMKLQGAYTSASDTLTANSVTVYLNN